MDKANSILTEWIISFLKHKDMITRNILDIQENKEGFDIIVKTKEKKQYYMIIPFIDNINEITQRLNKEDRFGLVIYNNKENLKKIINNWEVLSTYPNFCIFFVNPSSNLEKKWIIYPYTHNKITEKKSLDTGLKTMFETVENITKEELLKRDI